MEKLRVENLNFKVGKVEILKDVSFIVKLFRRGDRA